VADRPGSSTSTRDLLYPLHVDTGRLVVGDLLGSGEALERGVVGDTPNLAARLQIAEPDGRDPEGPEFEPIVICQSEGGLIIVSPSNGLIDEMVARGALAPAAIRTARGVRTIYASPSFARYLSADCGEEQERDDFRRWGRCDRRNAELLSPAGAPDVLAA
jgi:hypothetical protein